VDGQHANDFSTTTFKEKARRKITVLSQKSDKTQARANDFTPVPAAFIN